MADTFVHLPKLPMWLPDWLYESMPYIYVVAGFATIFHSDTPAGYGAGALFLLTALLIMKMRKDYRTLKDTIRLAKELTDYMQD